MALINTLTPGPSGSEPARKGVLVKFPNRPGSDDYASIMSAIPANLAGIGCWIAQFYLAIRFKFIPIVPILLKLKGKPGAPNGVTYTWQCRQARKISDGLFKEAPGFGDTSH